MEADTPLFHSSAFRLTATLFFGLSIALAIFGFYDNPPTVEGSSLSFWEWLAPFSMAVYERLKLPVLVAGISLPLLGLIASHLRSLQATSQIEAHNEQTKYLNYFSHRQLFSETLRQENLFSEKSCFRTSQSMLYSTLYPEVVRNGSLEAVIPNRSVFYDDVVERFAELIFEVNQLNWRMIDVCTEAQIALDDFGSQLGACFHMEYAPRVETESPERKLVDSFEKVVKGVDDLHTAISFIEGGEADDELFELKCDLERLQSSVNAAYRTSETLKKIKDIIEKHLATKRAITSFDLSLIVNELNYSEGKQKVEYLMRNLLKRDESRKKLLLITEEHTDIDTSDLAQRIKS